MNTRGAMALVLAAGLLMIPATAIADLIWDNNGATAPNPQDGVGDWNTTNSNWWNGSTNVSWSNESPTVAQFGFANGTGTVTVAETGVTATGLTFKKTYTLQTGPVTLAGAAPVIAFSGAASATAVTIKSNLAVTDGDGGTADNLVLQGTSSTISTSYGKLVFGDATASPTNTYSGTMILKDSILVDLFGVQNLSSTSTRTIVEAGSALRIPAASGTFGAGQTLELNGYGFGKSGNLDNSRAAFMLAPSPSGSLTWAGDIILKGNTSIASTQTSAGAVNTISGNISGIGKLVKNSDKTLALTGTCTYSGGTEIYRNVLQVDGMLGTVDSIVTVGTSSYTDATLKGTGSVLGDVVVNAAGTIEAGDSVGTLTVNGDVTVNGKYKIEYDSVADTIDKLIVNGDLNLSGATMSFSDWATSPETLGAGPHVFATYTGTLTQPTAAPTGIPAGFQIAWAYNGNSIALVPEPTVLVLLAGLALAMIARRTER